MRSEWIGRETLAKIYESQDAGLDGASRFITLLKMNAIMQEVFGLIGLNCSNPGSISGEILALLGTIDCLDMGGNYLTISRSWQRHKLLESRFLTRVSGGLTFVSF